MRPFHRGRWSAATLCGRTVEPSREGKIASYGGFPARGAYSAIGPACLGTGMRCIAKPGRCNGCFS